MLRTDLATTPSSVPQPRAGRLAAPDPSSPPVARGEYRLSMRGDRIDPPSAGPSPDPNGVCPVPNPERDQQERVRGLLIGGTIAAAIVAPEIVAATGLDELAGVAASTVVRGTSGVARTIGNIGSSAAKQFAEESAATADRFKDAEEVGKMIGHQAHSTLSTLGQSMLQGGIGAGIGALAYSKLRPQPSEGPPQPIASATAPRR